MAACAPPNRHEMARSGGGTEEVELLDGEWPTRPRVTSIGFFDSGVGGTSVLREVHRVLPDAPLLYLADQANCPYGPRPTAELQALSAANTRWLLERGAGLIVVACNTASAAALRWLRQHFPDVPFVGMVPAVKPAAQTTRSGVVGLLATPATLQGALLAEVEAAWAADVRIEHQLCPGFVERVEAGDLDSPDTRALVRRTLDPLLESGVDTIVLGCTHYPFLAPLIAEIAGPEVTILDAAPAVARQVVRLWRKNGEISNRSGGSIIYATTGDVQAFARVLARLDLPPGRTVSTTVR